MRGVLGWAVLFLPLALGACNEDTCVDCPPTRPYLDPTSPENLIENLERAYRNRDCDAYARILAPDFRFQFQPIDANTIGKEFWTFEPDSAGTCALFSSPEVAEIRIQLAYAGRDSTVDVSPPVDSLKIRIVTTDLQVDQTDGTTWVASDQQGMFFRKGLSARGENPNYWWLYEWDDLPSVYAPRSEFASHTTGVRLTTWGRLKTLYAD